MGQFPGNPYTSFHATVNLLDPPQIRDRIALLRNFHTNHILLSSSNKKLCMLGWGEIPGDFRLAT